MPRYAMSDSPVYDVVVIGLGAVGSAALCNAARAGARVLGIDRYHPPHEFGSTHGETRITRQAIGEGAQFVPLVLRANQLWRELEGATGEELLVQNGGVILLEDNSQQGSGSAFFQRTLDVARQFAIKHEVLDATTVRSRFPHFAISETAAAYYEPGAGFLYPERCVAAHLRMAAEHAGTIHTGETVTAIATAPQSITVQTDKNTYTCASVIVTPGPWMPDWVRQICGLPDETFKVYRQTLYWYPLEKPAAMFSPHEMPIFIYASADEEKSIYGFPSLDGRTIKVAGEQFHTTTNAHADAVPVDDEEAVRFYRELIQPRLRGIRGDVAKVKTCFYTQTVDQNFVIDHAPDSDSIWFASACSGHGFKHSAAVGEALAHKALGEPTRIDLTPFARRRLIAND